MQKHSLSFLVLTSLATLALSACQTTTASNGSDDTRMPKNPVPQVEQRPIDENRLSMIESRILTLEDKMASAQPTLKKVDAMQNHFRALSLELDRIEASYRIPHPSEVMALKTPAAVTPQQKSVEMAQKPQPKPVFQNTPEPKSKPDNLAHSKTPAAKSKSSNTVAAVTSIRIGEQKGEITRIVMDTTKPAEMKYDLDNGEHILMVELPGNKWAAAKRMDLKSSPMVKSFTATSDENGAHLVIQLKMTAKVQTTARLNPSGAYGHRVYLDVVPAK